MALCRKATELPACPLGDFKPPSSFKKHPGGQHHLEVARNCDCAGELFLSYHLGTDMGKVAAAANALGVAMPQRGPIYEEIYAMVSRLQAEHPADKHIFTAWCVLVSLALPVTSAWWLQHPSVFSSICVAQVFELYFFNVFHTRHHKGGRLYGIDLLNDVFGSLYEVIDHTWGYAPVAWRVNHHLKHHVYTNEVGEDGDMPGCYPVIRISESQPLMWFHKFQTFYWPLLLPGVVLSLPAWNVFVNGGKVIAFATWALIMVVLPMFLHGIFGLWHSLLTQMIAGVSLSYKFAVSHTHDNLGANLQDSNHKDIDRWIKAQVEEAQSWGGHVSCFLYGGISMQTEHHLCPSVNPTLYAYARTELQHICKAHGIRYTYEPTFFHAMWRFHQRLWTMGRSMSEKERISHDA